MTNSRHFLSVDDVNEQGIRELIACAHKAFERNQTPARKVNDLAGKLVFLLFFEPSTRTRMSFEVAGKLLGADVVIMNAEMSSMSKGESMQDMAYTLDAMRPDVMVIRHGDEGMPAQFAHWCDAAIINAGDGCSEHPTQALLDLATMMHDGGDVLGKKIVICGDILHSRVAGSNVKLLSRMGAQVVCVGPEALVPESLREHEGVSVVRDFDDALQDADYVMMLRIQRERMKQSYVASEAEYVREFGLNAERLALAKPSVKLLHPGPVNRDVEVTPELVEDAGRSLILRQVEMGVALRQAVMRCCLGAVA